MGLLDTAFSVFCEGLGSSSSLQVLDLRNNQINHDGASELGAALRRNTTLRSVGESPGVKNPCAWSKTDVAALEVEV